MAYEPTIWKNREVEKPRTFEIQNNPDGTVTLIPREGNVIETGTPIIADTMNKMETGIQQAHEMAGNVDDLQQEFVEHLADYLSHNFYGEATGTNNIYSVNISNVTELKDGMSIAIKIPATNTGASTLNVNDLGAKTIRDRKNQFLTHGKLSAPGIVNLRYSATVGGGTFFLQGEGGSGNAQPTDVIAGKTFTNDNGEFTGAMPKRTVNIVPSRAVQTIQNGYHEGSIVTGIEFAVGNESIYYDNSHSSSDTTNMSKIKEQRVNDGGVYRIEFRLMTNKTDLYVNAQIYKNGVPFGTLRTTAVASYTTYIEDLRFEAGDLIQLYASAQVGTGAYVTGYYIRSQPLSASVTKLL